MVIKADGVKLEGQEAGGAVQPPPCGRDAQEVVEEWQGVLGYSDAKMLEVVCRFIHSDDPTMVERLDDELRALAEAETEAGNIEVAE